ncbi:hypothetical protein [Sphingosinicella microcystinivorans]|uniref:hypothetical protein n=1 Tax=Sphingosinicella microcystinivorans TaxID=335406 RepID=UPI0022F403D5|nr:hypothetical protein [Sphingosinicella microcystinivorans]WBX82987.1 hypothetical protein PE061_14350 [Sphingosinicella microcystinivorans]
MTARSILAAGGLLLAQPVHAASQYYTVIWTVDPIAASLEEKTVKPGDVITEARLLPLSLLTIAHDAVGIENKIIAPGGMQMMELQANLRSACSFTFPRADLLERLWSGNQKFTCLVDEDDDGRFESAFTVMSSHIGIPSSSGKIPNRRTAINPVSYRRIPLSEGENFPRLLFKYSHQDKITGHAYFGICIANSTTRKEPCFDGYSGVRSDKLPKEIGAAGNLAIATAKQGALVTLTVKNGFVPMPFKAAEYVRWVFY